MLGERGEGRGERGEGRGERGEGRGERGEGRGERGEGRGERGEGREERGEGVKLSDNIGTLYSLQVRLSAGKRVRGRSTGRGCLCDV